MTDTLLKWALGGALVVSLGLNAWQLGSKPVEPQAPQKDCSTCPSAKDSRVLTKLCLTDEQEENLKACGFR